MQHPAPAEMQDGNGPELVAEGSGAVTGERYPDEALAAEEQESAAEALEPQAPAALEVTAEELFENARG